MAPCRSFPVTTPSPLAALAAWIPFIGRLLGNAVTMIALILSVPLTLVVIALAWLWVRPLIGGGILVLAALAIVALIHWYRVRRRKHAAVMPPQPPNVPPPPMPA